jgi:hypothetical protein
MQSGFANVFPFGNSGFNVAAQEAGVAHGPRSALAARLRGVRQDGGDFVSCTTASPSLVHATPREDSLP